MSVDSPKPRTSSPVSRPPPPIRWAAKVAPVKEVTLHGLADLAYWQEKLRPEGLEPAPLDGRAQVLLSATETRFWGILFRECLIGVQVSRVGQSGERTAGFFLVHAWNSVRFFAWVERTIFKTPYALGQIDVEPMSPARLSVCEHGAELMRAEQGAASEPESIAEETWEGPIFLPKPQNRPPQLFIAQLNGRTEHHPFIAGRDQLSLNSTANHAAVRSLLESEFGPTRWHLRRAAAHAKSKTYRVSAWYGD